MSTVSTSCSSSRSRATSRLRRPSPSRVVVRSAPITQAWSLALAPPHSISNRADSSLGTIMLCTPACSFSAAPGSADASPEGRSHNSELSTTVRS